LTPDEIRAAAEVHSELGPGYSDAVIDSFLEKVGREIDARVDARVSRQAPQPLDQHQHQHQHQQRHFQGSSFAVAVASLIFGIPISAITVNAAGGGGLFVAWLGIAIINVAYAFRRQPPAA
jgi:hypothetical protein